MSDAGYFYVMQLAPDFAPHRVKLGWTTKPHVRLRSHRTAAPTARLLQLWPCLKTWEAAAIIEIATGTKIGPEVFDCDNVDVVIERANAFFDGRQSQLLAAPVTPVTMNLRMPPELHAALKVVAERDGRSINNLIVRLLAQAVHQRA